MQEILWGTSPPSQKGRDAMNRWPLGEVEQESGQTALRARDAHKSPITARAAATKPTTREQLVLCRIDSSLFNGVAAREGVPSRGRSR